MTPSTIRKYGWKPSLPDHRDHKFSALIAPTKLPITVDLRPSCPGVYNQFDLGSCTANAGAGVIEFDQIKQHIKNFVPSRLFIYWNERSLDGSIDVDAGSTLRDCIKSLVQWGAPPESIWPYDTTKFKIQPPAAAYTAGLQDKALEYKSINQDLVSMQSCLASGFPFVLGFSVFESFESEEVAKTGLVTVPTNHESLLGGHAVVCVGYNNSSAVVNGIPPRNFIIRNSWGPHWGAKGYCYMPFGYLLDSNLADDFWQVTKIN